MSSALRVVIALAGAFVLGGIPWGLVLVRLLKGVDVRSYGSGKTGATNVLRLLGWPGFVAIILLDSLKGASAVLLARGLVHNPWIEAAAGFLAICGHTWSPFLGFRGGGRGMVTAMGAAFTMMPGLILLVPVFLIPVLVTRYMSLGNVIVSLVAPFVLIACAVKGVIPWPDFFFGTIGCVLILVNHADNIQRLLAGTERKIGEKPTPHVPSTGAQAH